MSETRSIAAAFGVGLVLAAGLCSCSKRGQGPVERSWGKMEGLEKIVGNMNDTSYSGVRTQKSRLNANGKPVAIARSSGQYLWVEYAAPWCKPCTWQAPEAKKVADELTGEVEFLTVMTSRSQAYNDHATVETAKAWAKRFRLPPERVLAAELWFKTIPEHRLYSPEGHTLFVHVGALSADQIKQVISYYRTGWDTWKQNGAKTDWMTFQ